MKRNRTLINADLQDLDLVHGLSRIDTDFGARMKDEGGRLKNDC